MKYSVTRLIGFCYGHRLLNYEGKCKNLHGHNGLIEVTVAMPKLDKLGMVMDFGEIKAKVQKWVDAELDHKTILHKKDPLVAELRRFDQPLVLLDENPTAENIALHIFRYAKKQGLPVKSLKVWETPTSFAEVGE